MNFKPFGKNMKDLLTDSHGEVHTSWVSALKSWTFEERLATSPLWYKQQNGTLQHRYLRNLLNWFEGEDRARQMSREMRERAPRETLDEEDGDEQETEHSRRARAAETARANPLLMELVYEVG